MNNPFEPINNRLTNLEGLTLEMLQLLRNHQPTNTAPSEQDEFLTPEETAKLLKVSKVTIWDWTANRGILTKHTIGNQVRYLKSEVLAAVLKKKTNSQPAATRATRQDSANLQTRKAA